MASAPPSFGAPDAPHVGRLPIPGNPSAGLTEGLDKINQAVAGADAQQRETGLQVASLNRQHSLAMAASGVAANLATMQGDLTVDLVKMRAAPGAGGADYESQVSDRLSKFRDDATGLLGNDPDLISHFRDNIASIEATARTGEAEWQVKQQALGSVQNYDTFDNAVSSNIRTSVMAGTASDKTLLTARQQRETQARALPIPASAQDKLINEGWIKDNLTAMDALIDKDPHAALTAIDGGALKMADDKQVSVLRNRADVEATKLDNQAKQAATEQDGVLRANAGNAIEDVHKGVAVDPTELHSWYAVVSQSQKPEDIRLAHDLKIAIAQNETTSKFDSSTNAERLAARAQIETHKDWQKDPMLVAAHDQLGTLIDRDQAASQSDSITLYQRQTGQPIGQLNLADPATMSQRFIAADRAQQRFGTQVPQVFTKAEADQYRQQYNQADVNGKAAFIQNLGAYGSERARQMMFQIAPNKPELGRLAELAANKDPAVRSLVQEASDGAAVPLKDGVPALIKNRLATDYGTAVSRLDGDRQRAIVQVATWIYAHRAAAAGKGNAFQPDIAKQSIEAALGGAGGKGGLGSRSGAPVVLPMGTTQDDFDRVLTMGAGHADLVRNAANGVPKWSDGSDMHQRQFLDLVPVLVHDDGVTAAYSFRSRSGSGYVKNEKGQDYLLDMRKLAQGLKGTMTFDQQLAAHGYRRY